MNPTCPSRNGRASEVAAGLDCLREGTESEHPTIKKMHPWKRARSFGEFTYTLDLAGYFFVRNIRAALAHERRTGHLPIRSAGPPDPGLAAA